MVVVAVTGGVGAGKSTVASLLARRGAVVVDADEIAREVVAPSGPSYRAVVDHFGPAVVGSDGTLDRRAIAARVFSDPAELAVLNALTHPAVAAVIASRVAEQAGSDSIVVLDVPLLGADARARYGLAGVIVVDAPEEVAVARLVEGRGWSEVDAWARVRAQIGRVERRALADVVIDNSGPSEALEPAVESTWTWIERLGGRG